MIGSQKTVKRLYLYKRLFVFWTLPMAENYSFKRQSPNSTNVKVTLDGFRAYSILSA